MNVWQQYQADIAAGLIFADVEQAKVLQYLTTLSQQLTVRITQKKRGLSAWLGWKKTPPLTGLYLWGGVGIGKTYMMDLFYQQLPFAEKLRAHFHVFMRDTHQALKTLQGQTDPLKKWAKQLSQRYQVLCFDEFFVKDIADAMLLAGIFTALFDEGLTLVLTSNVPPDKLYENGLQRGRFLPAIALLAQYTQVWHLPSLQDYRLRQLQQFGGYLHPVTPENQTKLTAFYARLTKGAAPIPGNLPVLGREIAYLARHEEVIWFDFNALCCAPRSSADYLVLAAHYTTVLIQGLPKILAKDVNTATYFIQLVDVFYDSRVKLIILAQANLADIYPTGPLAFEFARTKSRLQEMQSETYWHEKVIHERR